MSLFPCSTCFYADRDTQEYPCIDCKVDDLKYVNRNAYGEDPETEVEVGVKFDNDKPQWSLVPFAALSKVVDVLTYGAAKYAPDNWKKVPNARQRYIDAGFRHFTAYASGEKNDPETGMSHLAHAMCCLLFLLSFDIGNKK